MERVGRRALALRTTLRHLLSWYPRSMATSHTRPSNPLSQTPTYLPGAELVRINLSEQTDMMDLLGADLPVAGGAPGEFAW